MKYKLDFNIETSHDRCQATHDIDFSECTKKDLELIANYILYGKDEDGTSIVDRKEIQIKPKFGSYQRKEPVSLDALLESPTFNEAQLSTSRNIYKKIKPSIDKEKAKNVPGMQQLWDEIERFQRIIDENTGKSPKTDSTPLLDSKQLYYMKHHLIDLRRQQYYLMDSVYPTLPPPQNKSQFYGAPIDAQMNYHVFPRGVMRTKDDMEFCQPLIDKDCRAAATPIDEVDRIKASGKPYIDFMNKNHIYQLVLYYWDIKMAIEGIPDSPLHNLLWTLDFYIEKANLSEQQMLIVKDKKLRILNKDIAQHLQKELGIYHQENYISTIWNKVTQLIADAAELNYDEWLAKDYAKAWKKCNKCGEMKLRDPRNFVRKAKAADGLIGRCKKCDRVERQKKKEINNG